MRKIQEGQEMLQSEGRSKRNVKNIVNETDNHPKLFQEDFICNLVVKEQIVRQEIRMKSY